MVWTGNSIKSLVKWPKDYYMTKTCVMRNFSHLEKPSDVKWIMNTIAVGLRSMYTFWLQDVTASFIFIKLISSRSHHRTASFSVIHVVCLKLISSYMISKVLFIIEFCQSLASFSNLFTVVGKPLWKMKLHSYHIRNKCLF